MTVMMGNMKVDFGKIIQNKHNWNQNSWLNRLIAWIFAKELQGTVSPSKFRQLFDGTLDLGDKGSQLWWWEKYIDSQLGLIL